MEDGDSAAYDRIDKQIDDLPKPEKPEKKPDPKNDPVLSAWEAENDWYVKNPRMAKWADDMAPYIAKAHPHLAGTGRPFYDKVAEAVREEFPKHFENPNRSKPNAVEGTSTTERKRGKTFADLPPEAKQACKRFVKQGVMTQEKYLQEYEWE